jgi:site-specific recombinase XerD
LVAFFGEGAHLTHISAGRVAAEGMGERSEESWNSIFPIYNLCHAFASRMTAAGFSPITIAQMLGHSSTQIVPRYAQVLASLIICAKRRVAVVALRMATG